MPAILNWKGLAYQSSEKCIFTDTGNGYEVNAVIDGFYNNTGYHTTYTIQINQHWAVTAIDICNHMADKRWQAAFRGDGAGNWITDGKPQPGFTGCIDIDISLTPFTNTLPIRRLAWPGKEQQVIRVLYFDVLEEQISAVDQLYTKTGTNSYLYENTTDEFKALVTVDAHGFVTDYPSLFARSDAG